MSQRNTSLNGLMSQWRSSQTAAAENCSQNASQGQSQWSNINPDSNVSTSPLASDTESGDNNTERSAPKDH